MTEIKSPKKLIEVALPLDDINIAAAKGKVDPARPPQLLASVVGASAFGGGTGGYFRTNGQ